MALGHGNVGIRSTGAWEHELQLHWPPNREGSDDELRYGRINVDGGRTKLAFGRPDSVRWPENGCLVDVYDLWNTSQDTVSEGRNKAGYSRYSMIFNRVCV